ncbi:type I polyketide synthase [Lentzea sp. CA-135723]|uniref:type I polyketide synthase n=1 Tax=Lentzea sp. CA-135723 TaxID=3239950 RepID=UPI003D93B363
MTRDDAFDVAVTGLYSRLPGPADPGEWMAAVGAGEVFTGPRDLDELIAAGVPEARVRDSEYVPVCGYLPDADRFETALFGMSPRDAEMTDPQHRLMLEAAWAALEDAGRDPLDASVRTGVYASSSSSAYQRRILVGGELPHDMHDRLEVGTGQDYMATRIAYKLGSRGPALTVQTACSSSLVALHTAVQALLGGDCDQALVVAASIGFPQEGHLRVRGGIMSAGGACRPFDAGADGTLAGSGVVALVLRRLADVDGAAPHGIILGTAVNNDGQAKAGYNAPSAIGQEAVIRAALRTADVPAASLGYLEAHATGTYVGDPIEWKAMCAALDGVPEGQIRLGAVKANIGHLDAASGLASVAKTLRVLRDGVIPPVAGFTELNPMLATRGAPVSVPTEATAWQGPEPRRAGVSSFGIGGTNAHVILQQAPPRPEAPSEPLRDSIFVLSAADSDALGRSAERLADHVANARLDDVAHTLVHGRAALNHRLAVVGRTPDEVARRLRTERTTGVRPLTGPAPLVFLFPGQGSTPLGMGLAWRDRLPGFAEFVEECLAELPAVLAGDVRRALYDRTSRSWRYGRTDIAQPALFVLEHSATQALRGLGLRPAAVAGHSLGELTSACVAGVLTRGDALRLVTARGKLMQDCPKGRMLAVGCGEADVRKLLDESGAQLEIAAVNTSDSCVVSGTAAAVEAFTAHLGDRVFHRQLTTLHGFHSALVEGAIPGLEAELAGITARPAAVPFLANATGELVDAGTPVNTAMFAESARGTVRFADGLNALAQRFPGAVAVEVGPGRALSGSATAEGLTGVALASSRDDDAPLTGLAALWTLGQPVDLTRLVPAGTPARLPGYPFHGRVSTAPEAGRAVQAPEPVEAVTAEDSTPRALLTSLWQEWLGYPDLTDDADFFAIGGDSLVLIRLIRRLSAALDVKIAVREFAAARTLGDQIALVEAATTKDES